MWSATVVQRQQSFVVSYTTPLSRSTRYEVSPHFRATHRRRRTLTELFDEKYSRWRQTRLYVTVCFQLSKTILYIQMNVYTSSTQKNVSWPHFSWTTLYMSSSHRSNRLGLSHWDLYAMRRGSCLELYYCNMMELFWCDSSVILTTNWFNCPEMTCIVLSGTLSNQPTNFHRFWNAVLTDRKNCIV